MARARSGKNKRRAKKATAKGRAKVPAKGRAARRRRAPRVKARSGPVQLWLPLQMPLGLLGGHAVAPEIERELECDDAESPLATTVGEQSSLFE